MGRSTTHRTTERQNKLGRKERAMMCFAYCLPVFVLVSVLIHGWARAFSMNLVGAAVILFVGSCLVARFLLRRAKNLEAVIYTTRILPSESDEMKSAVDVVAVVVGIAILLTAAFLPML